MGIRTLRILGILLIVLSMIIGTSGLAEAMGTVTSCDKGGNAKDDFLQGEDVYITYTGLKKGTAYDIWIVLYTAEEHVAKGEDFTRLKGPGYRFTIEGSSGPPESPLLIWKVPGNVESNTYYDIVLDENPNDEFPLGDGIYQQYDDSLDATSVDSRGIVVTPELPTLVLLLLGLVGVVGYVGWNRRNRTQIGG